MGELLFMKPVFKEAVWGSQSQGKISDMRYQVTVRENAGASELIKMETARFTEEPIKGNIYRNCGQIIRSFLEMKMEIMQRISTSDQDH